MVASGELDVAILTFGGLWDFAATSLIVTEAGGVFRDAWGGKRFDTATGVFTNDALVDQVLAALAELRPDAPDAPQLAKTVSTPIGTDAEQAADEWRRFGVRPLPSMSARRHVDNAPPPILAIVDERAAELERPFLGVTTDGVVRTGLRSLGGIVGEHAADHRQPRSPSCRRSRPNSASGSRSRWTRSSGACGSTST